MGQTGTVCDVQLVEPGTNTAVLFTALQTVKPGFTEPELKELVSGLLKPVLRGVTKDEAEKAAKALSTGGARAQVWIVPTGPDIARGWGKRRSVAEDALFDYPVMPGSQRIGPDLADVGSRQPDLNWHLRHLYAPQAEVKGSIMPPYRYLFEKRRVERGPSSEALALTNEFGPGARYEIVPTTEAKALAAYLISLRANTPLFTAPLTLASISSGPDTNAPAASAPASTNAAPANAPAK